MDKYQWQVQAVVTTYFKKSSISRQIRTFVIDNIGGYKLVIECIKEMFMFPDTEVRGTVMDHEYNVYEIETGKKI